MNEKHASHCRNKNEPALKEMEETFRRTGPPEVSEHARPDNAQGVACYGNGEHQDD